MSVIKKLLRLTVTLSVSSFLIYHILLKSPTSEISDLEDEKLILKNQIHETKQPMYNWVITCNCSLVDKLKQYGQVLNKQRIAIKDTELIKAPLDHYKHYSTVFEGDKTFFKDVLAMPVSEVYFLPWTYNIMTWRSMNYKGKEDVVTRYLPVQEYHPTFLTKSIHKRFAFNTSEKASEVVPASILLSAKHSSVNIRYKPNTYLFDYHGMSPHKPRCPGKLDYDGGWDINKDCETHRCYGFPDMMTFLIILKGQTYKISLGQKGRIYIPDTNQKLVMSSCYKADAGQLFDDFIDLDEVFYMSQAMAGGIYHGLAESLTKIAMFVPFLKQNPSIKILFTSDGYSKLLLPIVVDTYQLSNEIIYHANRMVQANTVYVPPGMHCFRGGDVMGLQMTSQHFHQWTEKNFSQNKTRNLIIILRRSTRHLQNYDAMYHIVKTHVKEISQKLILYEFNDKHLPSVQEAIQLFYRALVVIGVNGAGLTNIIFSQPGTHLVEFLCGYMNPTFKEMSYKLGIYHYPLVSAKMNSKCHTEGPVVELEEVNDVMSRIFKARKSWGN